MSITVTKISENIYEFNEGMMLPDGSTSPYVDAYLYIGRTKAAVIDTLQHEDGLYAAVRALTDLPLEVLITHGHPDHAGASTGAFYDAGCPIWMDAQDLSRLKTMVPATEDRWFSALSDGQTFDLGGITLTAIHCEGHTIGSYVFLDAANKLLFSGDTVGSGTIWMQIPGCVSISRFEASTRRLLNILTPLRLNDVLVYPGHRYQSPVQLTGQIVEDDWEICRGILNGSITGEDRVMDMRGMHLSYKETSRGQMRSFCYDPERVMG